MFNDASAQSWTGNRRGATAVEFALIAPVFLFMVMAIIEYSLFYFKTSFLKHVLYEASRNVQTGEVQDAVDPQAYFQTEYCSDAAFLVDCQDVFFDVRSSTDLASITFPAATFDSSGVPTNFVFQPGGPDTITTMRVATPYEFFTPMLQNIFQPDGDPAIIVGYTVARNEPF